MEKEIYLSSNLKYLRIANNKTQVDLAKVIGKGASAIGNYENGLREPTAVDLGKLAEYFDVSVDDLLLKDLRLDNLDIEEGKYITMPKDYKKFKKGERIPVQDVLDYVEEMQDKIDKIWENLK